MELGTETINFTASSRAATLRGRVVHLRTSTGIDAEYRYDKHGRLEKAIDRKMGTGTILVPSAP